MDDQFLSDNIFVARPLRITAIDPDLAPCECEEAKPFTLWFISLSLSWCAVLSVNINKMLVRKLLALWKLLHKEKTISLTPFQVSPVLRDERQWRRRLQSIWCVQNRYPVSIWEATWVRGQHRQWWVGGKCHAVYIRLCKCDLYACIYQSPSNYLSSSECFWVHHRWKHHKTSQQVSVENVQPILS